MNVRKCPYLLFESKNQIIKLTQNPFVVVVDGNLIKEVTIIKHFGLLFENSLNFQSYIQVKVKICFSKC